MVDDVYPEMLKEAELNPAAPGTLEKLEKVDGQELPVHLQGSVDARSGTGRLSKVRLRMNSPRPAGKLNQAIEELQQMSARPKPWSARYNPATTSSLI